MSICGRSDDECVNEVLSQWQIKQNNASFACNCLPGCFEINYDPGISMTPLFDQSPILLKNRIAPKTATLVHVFYRESHFRSQIKAELVGFTDFLCKHRTLYEVENENRIFSCLFLGTLRSFFSARTGGLLSLFMGFSLISIVEIVYFLTIRPYCNFKRKNEEKYRPNNNRWKRMFQRFQKIKSRRIESQNTTLNKDWPVLDKSSD